MYFEYMLLNISTAPEFYKKSASNTLTVFYTQKVFNR